MSAPPAAARSPARLGVWLAFVLLFVALQYYGRTQAEPPDDLLYRWSTFVSGLAQGVLMLAFTLALAWNGPARELFALRRPRSWARAARYSVVVLVGIVVVAAALDGVLDATDEQGFVPEAWDPDRAAPFAANFVVAALLFPLVEELLFRGVGYTLVARWGAAAAVVVTGVLFALAHGLVNALPILIAFGIGLGWLRERTASIVPCVVVHAVFNAVALIGAVAVERGG